MISVILPTYNEAQNIKRIIYAITNVFLDGAIKGEVIVVDDDSPDGTAGIASDLAGSCPVKIHVRKSGRSLSRSIIEGFGLAQGDICVVMDADLSHPAEKIPDMIKPILEGKCDATVGSRYIYGGGAQNWPLLRRISSRGAGLLAKGVTTLSDPTSGFMAVRKNTLEGIKLDPLGWKFVLEVVVKTKARVLEIPIVFKDRKLGESKLGFRAQMDYLRHLGRLYTYRYPQFLEFSKFCLVGLSGLLIDTAVLVSLVVYVSLDPRIAAVFAFSVAVSWSYLFSNFWADKYGETISNFRSSFSFISIYLVGLAVRIGVMHLLIEYADMGAGPWYILASCIGIVASTVLIFLGGKYVAFKRRR